MSQPQPPRHLGPYELRQQLGSGAMGSVYLAHQESLGRDLAIKILDPQVTSEPGFVERFQREGRAAASLRHPHIIQVVDVCSTDGYHYVVMEFVPGSDLLRLMDSPQRPNWRRAVELTSQILDALDSAHKAGIVHRAVKPANVLLNSAGQVVLTDFSLAPVHPGGGRSGDGNLVGSPDYLAPEQLEGGVVDGRADIYAASLLLYEMLTSTHPFRSQSISEIVRAQLSSIPISPDVLNPDLPKGLSALVMRGLAKNPAERPDDAGVMASQLRKFMSEPDPAPATPIDDFLAEIVGSPSLSQQLLGDTPPAPALLGSQPPAREEMAVLLASLDLGTPTPGETITTYQTEKEFRDRLSYLFRRSGAHDFQWSLEACIVLFGDAQQALTCAQTVQADFHHDKQYLRLALVVGEVFKDPNYAQSQPALGEHACKTVAQGMRLLKECPLGDLRLSRQALEQSKTNLKFHDMGKNQDGVEVRSLEGPLKEDEKPQPESSEFPNMTDSGRLLFQAPPAAFNPFSKSGELPAVPSESQPPANPFASGALSSPPAANPVTSNQPPAPTPMPPMPMSAFNPAGPSGSLMPPPPPPPVNAPVSPPTPRGFDSDSDELPMPFPTLGSAASSELMPPPPETRKATLAGKVEDPLPSRPRVSTLAVPERSWPNPKMLVAGVLLVAGLGAGYHFSQGSPKPTPTPAKAAVTALVLECKPDKVEVSIDKGKPKPYTKGAKIELPPGTHSVVVSAKGYAKFTKKVTVKAGESQKLAVTLKKGK